MTLFFLECTIRAALIVLGTAMVLYAMRVKIASIKHRVWTAILLLMLVLPAWTAWGPKAEFRLLPASVERLASRPLAPVSIPAATAPQLATQPIQIVTPRERVFSAGEETLLAIYLLGLFTLLFRLAIGTIKAQRLIRNSRFATTLTRHPEARPGTGEPKDLSSSAANRTVRDPAEIHSNLSSRTPGAVSRGKGSAAGLPPPGGQSFSSDIHPSHTSGVLTPEEENFAIRSSSSCSAPVTVGCLRPTVILPQHWHRWSPQQLETVLAHEGEHVRRRDPLVQWLALLNRAIFWFHPAAWWLERELSALAEESCDAAVIAQGHDPRDYAETLMKIARDVMDSGSRINSVAVAMPGPRLPERIRTIIDAAPLARISRARTAWVMATCAAISAAFLAVTLTRAQSNQAPTPLAQPDSPVPSFDVASVKPTPSEDREVGTFFTYPGGRIEARGCTLTYLIMVAYGVQKFQISGADGWIDNDRFSISAEPPADSPAKKINPSNPKLPPPHEEALMLRSLLADRFQLALKQTTQDANGFALVLKNPHPNLSAPKDNHAYPVVAMGPTGDPEVPTYLQGINASMSKFAERLSSVLSVPVIDQTGLPGSYDFLLKYAPSTDENASGPLLNKAIEDIGLTLQPAKVPILHLSVAHAAKPSAN